jgi:large repetitive protein
MKKLTTIQTLPFVKRLLPILIIHLLCIINVMASEDETTKRESKKILLPPTPTVTVALPPSAASTCYTVLTATGCGTAQTRWYAGSSIFSFSNPVIVATNISQNLKAVCYDSGLNQFGSYSPEYKALSVTYTEVIPNVSTICAGASIALNASSANAGLTYQWRLNSSNISGETSSSYSASVAGSYSLSASNGSCSSISSGASVAVTPLPAPPTSITKNPTGAVNPGTSVSLTASTCGTGNTFKWEDNSTANPRAVTPNATATYSVKCVSGTCESTTSTSVTVDVLPTITVSNTTPTNICSNAGTSFPVAFTTTGAFTGSFTVTLTKVLYRCDQPQTYTIATATTASSPVTVVLPNFNLSPSISESCYNDSYRINITNTSTLGAISSNSYVVIVPPRPIISTSYTGSCGSQTANFTTQTMPSGTFQWKKDGVNVGSPNTGTSSTYAATVAGSYTVDYTDAICTVTSNAVVFNQNAVPTIALIPPVSPNCYSKLTATGCLGTVNWERDYGTSWSVYTTGNPFVFPVSTNPTDYRATCTLNGCTSSPSNVQQATPNNFTQIIPSPTIDICSNASTLLNASSTFSGLTYQWRRNYSNISGANTSSYTATLGGDYQLYVTNGSCAFMSSVTSVGVATAPILSITSTLTSPATITNGQSLTLNANGCSGGTVLWSNSATTTSITVTPSSNTTYTFTCTKPPCIVISSGFVVNVNPLLPPTLTSSAVSTCTGSSVTLTASACAGGGTVTWSTAQTGLTITVSPSVPTNYTATCTVGLVTSANSSPISIAVFDGVITSLASGDWNTPATWSCNCIPAACNDVIVDTGHVVTIPATQKGRLKNLTLRGIVDVKTTGTMSLK